MHQCILNELCIRHLLMILGLNFYILVSLHIDEISHIGERHIFYFFFYFVLLMVEIVSKINLKNKLNHKNSKTYKKGEICTLSFFTHRTR
jgi:hypothetical protein